MLGRIPRSSAEMRNPFVVLRFVLFAILVYVNLLIIGFAVWNLTVLKGLDVRALGAPRFVIFNACILIALLVVCLVSSWFSRGAFDKVRDECIWTGLMSALLLASCIAITVNGPPTLCQGISITACASSSLMVALSWVSSTMLLMYSFALVTTTITHMSVIPDVWSASICSVPWFVVPSQCVESRMPPPPEKTPRLSDVVDIKRSSLHFPTPIFEQHAKTLPLSPKSPVTPPIWQARRSSLPMIDAPPTKRTTWTNRVFSGMSQCSTESVRPTWATRGGAARRGVDHPFAVPRAAPKPVPIRPLRPFKLKSCWSPSTASSHSHLPAAPAPPPKARVAARSEGTGIAMSPTSTFYIDLERDAVVPVGVQRPVSYGMFPEDVVDPDMPITHSQPSTWVRADSDAASSRPSSR
ncbi:hypothetical protein C8Q78DRAFT_697722 [Trametes maxima]|nr:hypothetical protein C8Q78DRAFT_697722 [Trametes maxima]